MKIVLIATRLFRPVSEGQGFALDCYSKALSCGGENELHLITWKTEGKEVDKNLYNEFSSITILPDSSALEKIKNILVLSALKRKPLQYAAIYSKASMKKVRAALKDIKPDVVIFDMLRTGVFYKKIKKYIKFSVMEMCDILSDRYQETLKSDDSQPILGQFSKKLPTKIMKFCSSKFVNRFVTKFEYKAIKRQENKSPQIYDKVVLISKRESESLISRTRKNNILHWPMYVLTKENNFSYSSEYNPKSLFFLGNFNVAQNADTLKFMVQKILPKLPEEFSLSVSGYVPDNLKKIYSSTRIRFLGYVPSIEIEMKKHLCLFAPIQYGSGVKTKILQALAINVPVITSKYGEEGINLVNGENAFVCENVEDYLSAIYLLSSNELLREQISLGGYKLVQEEYSFDNLVNQIQRTFKRGDYSENFY